ncbi:MAG: MFS transporter [bacterium]
MVYAGFCVFGMAFQFVPPLIPTLIRELQLNHGQAGLLLSFFALPGIIILSIPGGYLVDRFGVRSIGTSGLGLMALGTAGMVLPVGYHWLLLLRAVAGLGAMVSVVAMQRTVTLLFTGRPLGLPMGIVNTAVPLGIVLALNGALPLAERCGWRNVAAVVAILAGLCCLGYLVMCSRLLAPAGERNATGQAPRHSGPTRLETDQRANDSPATATDTANVSFRLIWLAGAVWFFANGAVTSFVTFAPDHYLDLGLGAESIGIFVSLPMWCAALLGPLIGWLTDRRGGKGAIIATGMWVMAVFLIWVPSGIFSPLVLGLGLGLALCCLPTPLLSLPGDILSSSHHGRAFGILSACANAGIFLVPPIAGTIRDATGAYFWPFLLMAGVAAAGMVVAFWLPTGRLPRGWAWLYTILLPLALLVLFGF